MGLPVFALALAIATWELFLRVAVETRYACARVSSARCIQTLQCQRQVLGKGSTKQASSKPMVLALSNHPLYYVLGVGNKKTLCSLWSLFLRIVFPAGYKLILCGVVGSVG
ncbi:hypothetical protein GGR58DRAFT_465265 [Xylaria digitata]|nr:hypothetical protein GGR58DRAFT_465265 [Xylaria digitata]